MVNTSNQKSTAAKIMDLDGLAKTLEQLRSEGNKVVQCHGVFDLLHVGHIRHFQQARRNGDILVVTLTPDRFVNKGPGRPVFTESLRAEAVAALDTVDYVAVNRWPLAVGAIKLVRPNFYVKGSDYKDAEQDRSGGIIKEEAAVYEVGGQIVFTEGITFSSSSLINQHLPVFHEEVKDYLADLSSRNSSENLLKYLEDAQSLKVLVVGETIIDEYVYCETIGKSGKDPILATRYVSKERFAGGIVPVANHTAAFCDQVNMLTFLGREQSHEDFVRENTSSNVEITFLYNQDSSPTILKRRFVEVYPFQRLFEVYEMNDGEERLAETAAFCEKLEEILPNYDVVIVADYGHGMLAPQAVDMLCANAKFLAINTQVNAGNRGFNTVTKYSRADFISISESEIRLDARSRHRDLREIVEDISGRMACERMIITRGAEGCLAYSRSEGFVEVPAVALEVVDRMGAGDTVLSVTSLCAALEAPIEVIGLVGNAAGAEAVATVGHRKSLERVSFFRHIETLLK